jgi:photosystem II stability/assembly factor-like uncharacterized protein
MRDFTAQGLGFLYSEDAGTTWTSLNSLPQEDANIVKSAASPKNFNSMYVSVFSQSGARSYYSTDGAKTFKRSGLPIDVAAYYPNDTTGKRMFGYAWQSGIGRALYTSTDAGATWKTTGTLPAEIINVQDPKTRVSKIVIDPADEKTIYMAGSSAYLWKSVDAGATWKTVLSLDTLP